MMNRLRNNKPVYCIGSKSISNQSKKISIKKTINIEKYEKNARPEIITINNNNSIKDIYAIPDEKSLGFKLYSSTNPNLDYLSLWQKNFSNPCFPSPVLDISMHKETDFCLAATSSDLLRLYAFPL